MSLPNELLPVGLLGTGASEAYQISRSVRLNSSDSAYFSRTPSTAGNRKTWTYSVWAKRSKFGGYAYLLSTGSDNTGIRFDPSTNKLELFDYPGSYAWQLMTTQVFRDPSAWYHIVIALDTTQATASNRLKLYVNGVQVTSFDTSSYPSQNYEGPINNNTSQAIGLGVAGYFDGYLADVHFIDGGTPSTAVDSDGSVTGIPGAEYLLDFGEFDATTGVWNPKAYTGSYNVGVGAVNGFHLPFSDNSTAAALGTDTSGAGNDWDVYNISTVDISRNYTNLSCSSTGNVSVIYINSVSQTVNVANLNTLLESSQFHDRASGGNGYQFHLPGTSGSTVTLNYSNMNNLNSVKIRLQRVATIDSTVRVEITGAATSDVVATVNSQEFSFATTTSSGTIKLTTQNSSNGVVCQDIFFDPGDTTSDSLVDTPTNGSQTDTGVGGEVVGNYATLNPNVGATGTTNVTLSNGNLEYANSDGTFRRYIPSTITMPSGSGKYYAEGVYTTSTQTDYDCFGIIDATLVGEGKSGGSNVAGIWAYRRNGNADIEATGGTLGISYGASWAVNDVIGIAYDSDNGSITFYKNGVSQGQLTTGITNTVCFFVAGFSNCVAVLNFGQRPFAYTAPSGYKALCTANLDDPVVAQPSTVMDVVKYDGNSSTQTISGLGFSPDLVWIKCRSIVSSHVLQDRVRGETAYLISNSTSAENTNTANDWFRAFTSDGFTVAATTTGGAPTSEWNASGNTYVAWTWDAGDTTDPANEDGSITSQVRANASAGFSIVTYTGNNTTSTVGHGLNATPSLVIVKSRSATSLTGWMTKHSSLQSNYNLALNLTDAAWNPSTNGWVGDLTSSTTFSLVNGSSNGNNVNQSGVTYVAYCFAPVDGYSSFGSYVGNGSSDGVFVYTGMRPRFLLVKNSNNTDGWSMWDAARDPYNEVIYKIEPNSSGAEGSNAVHKFDFLSNGFKVRGNWAGINGSGNTIIYACFAENPFKYSRAR